MTKGSNSNAALRGYVERIERLEGEKKTISDDVKEVYSEAKGAGYDPKILRKVIALRKKDRATVEEENALLATYFTALGMEWLA